MKKHQDIPGVADEMPDGAGSGAPSEGTTTMAQKEQNKTHEGAFLPEDDLTM